MTLINSRRSFHFRLLLATFLFLSLLTSVFTLSGTASAAAPADPGRGCWERQIFWPPTLTSTPQYLLNGADTVLVSQKFDQPSNIIKIVLKSETYMGWWKGISVIYGANVIAQTFTEGNIKSNSVIFSYDSKYTSYYFLRFEKAKLFGVHTGIYCLRIGTGLGNNYKWGGSTITFDWTED